MIEANKNEAFPITVSLFNESTGQLVTSGTVTYDIRTIDDAVLIPSVSGVLSESSVEPGIYKTEVSIPSAGIYICYATCEGFVAGTEDILISEENIYEAIRYNMPHNISVTDYPRATISGATTASQIARKVPYGKTDYIATSIKRDSDLDWSNPVSSGVSYAHYTSLSSELPFRMGGAL